MPSWTSLRGAGGDGTQALVIPPSARATAAFEVGPGAFGPACAIGKVTLSFKGD